MFQAPAVQVWKAQKKTPCPQGTHTLAWGQICLHHQRTTTLLGEVSYVKDPEHKQESVNAGPPLPSLSIPLFCFLNSVLSISCHRSSLGQWGGWRLEPAGPALSDGATP